MGREIDWKLQGNREKVKCEEKLRNDGNNKETDKK
jgi:hypothetical protein